jgi:hypothetical protein
MTAPREPYAAEPTSVLAPRRRFGADDGDKPTYLTTEFLVFAVLTVGLLLTAVIIQDTDDHADYFRADRAWWYVTLLAIAYIASRGLAKLGRGGDRRG